MISKSSRIVRIIVLIILIGVCLYLKTSYNFNFSSESNYNISIGLSIAMILMFLKLIIDLVALWFKLSKKLSRKEQQENIIVGLSNLFAIISGVIIVLGILSVFGLKPSRVFTSLSIVAAAIAVITKEFIAEIAIGVMNGFSSKIDIDDYIKVGNNVGRVIDLGLQKVTLLNDEGEVIYIPNIKFHNEELINYTKKEDRRLSFEFQLHKNSIKSLEELDSSLSKLLYEFDEVEKNTHELKIKSIQESIMSFRLDYKVKFISQNSQIQIRKKLLKLILKLSLQN